MYVCSFLCGLIPNLSCMPCLQLLAAQRGLQAADKDMMSLAAAKAEEARKAEARLNAQREVCVSCDCMLLCVYYVTIIVCGDVGVPTGSSTRRSYTQAA